MSSNERLTGCRSVIHGTAIVAPQVDCEQSIKMSAKHVSWEI